VNDDVSSRHERPDKYKWTEHAERNAIYNSAAFGAPLVGCTLYCTHPPCTDCARAVIQSGVWRVVFVEFTEEMATRWAADYALSSTMFKEVGTIVTVVPRSELIVHPEVILLRERVEKLEKENRELRLLAQAYAD
jgi:dCMP deaminase